MKWIDTTDLRSWANRRDCQNVLPLLIRRLIRATSISIDKIKFPSGDNILIGGWDGILETSVETEYLPNGTSLWEFGTNKNIKSKADGDYRKRTDNPLGYKLKESTFVFVTPRFWQNAEDWANEKKAERKWKDVKVISAEILEEWLDVAPTVSAWLAKHIGKYPNEGIQSTNDFIEEWSTGINFNLDSDILLGGRSEEKRRVLESLSRTELLSVQGISREESLAFIIACFNTDTSVEDFYSRSIIVDKEDAFRELTLIDTPLVLIPRFEDHGVFNRALKKGHTILVPLGADSTNLPSNSIRLPRIDRDPFISALVKSGLNKELAEKYSKESARNITVLRRQLEFNRTIPEWAKPECVTDLIPALVIGRWDEKFEEDKRLIAKIAGSSYEEYIKRLSSWLYTADSPILKIGSYWRLTSPFDSWSNASRFLGEVDFKWLHSSAIEVLSELNPAFELEREKRYIASVFGKQRKYSQWLREGVIQSLILTSILGDDLSLNLPQKAGKWVDSIVHTSLEIEDSQHWKSLEGLLPLLAEASPNSFLNAIDRLLKIDDSPIISLFDEEPGFITARSYHTNLLWALESLAWFPQYFSRATLLLAKLSSVDPGGSISNRPINCLKEIFKTWHYQTLSSFEERMDVLDLISERVPNVAWELLLSMVPNHMGDTGSFTYRSRWRMFSFDTNKPVTLKEIYDTQKAVVGKLLPLAKRDEKRICTLLEISIDFSVYERDEILSYIENVVSKYDKVGIEVWHASRKLLYLHRSYPDADWSLSEVELVRYQKIYDLLKPTIDIDNLQWLFEEQNPEFAEGNPKEVETYEEYSGKVRKRRLETVASMYEKHGIMGVIKLIDLVKNKWVLGDIVARVIKKEEEIFRICDQLKRSSKDHILYMVFSVVIALRMVWNGLFLCTKS